MDKTIKKTYVYKNGCKKGLNIFESTTPKKQNISVKDKVRRGKNAPMFQN